MNSLLASLLCMVFQAQRNRGKKPRRGNQSVDSVDRFTTERNGSGLGPDGWLFLGGLVFIRALCFTNRGQL